MQTVYFTMVKISSVFAPRTVTNGNTGWPKKPEMATLAGPKHASRYIDCPQLT